MIRQANRHTVCYRFARLAVFSEITHAIFTRLGGNSEGPYWSLNVGAQCGDRPEDVQANELTMLGDLGLQPGDVVTAAQVHGSRVAVVGSADKGRILPATDGLLTAEAGVFLFLRFADCLPVLLYDPLHKALALVHVGWRGCLAGVLGNTVLTMVSTFGTRPSDVVAGLGPGIGPCCYEIGPDLVYKIRSVFGEESGLLRQAEAAKTYFDLPGAASQQLGRAGILQIESAAMCTCCHTGEFFSHRGQGGRAGRFGVVCGLRDR